jgi:hypothetical protein
MPNDDLGCWLPTLRRYLAIAVAGHLLWEALQVPLYTIWREGTATRIAFAVVHCTGGDLLIATASLAGALVIAGTPRWPSERFRAVALLTLAFGLAYTVYSEWLNVSVRGSWAYSPRMPRLPPFGTGLSPVLQWIAVPSAAFAALRGAGRRGNADRG